MPECFERHVRIDRVSTVTKQQTVMMDFAGFAGFQNDSDLCTLFVAHQVMVNGTTGHHGRQTDSIASRGAVRKRNQAEAIGYRL